MNNASDDSPETTKTDEADFIFKRRSFSFQMMPCQRNDSQGNTSGDKKRSTTDSEEKEKHDKKP